MISRGRAAKLLAGGATLGVLGTRRAGAQEPQALRIATIPAEPAAEPYFAKELGLFAKAGLDADISPNQSSAAIAAAVLSNAVDVGYVSVDVVAGLHEKNIPLVIIAPATEYISPQMLQTAGLVVPASSTVRQAKELNGKVVAVTSLHGLIHLATRAWIDQNGGDSSTVKFIEIPLPATTAALESGRVDAGFLVEPFLTFARKDNRVLAYGLDAISKHFCSDSWCATPQWVKDHPNLVRSFAGVMHDAAAWANKNPQQSGAVLAKYTKIDPAVLATMQRVRYAEVLSAPLMQPLIDVAVKYYGYSPLNAQDLVYVPQR